MDEIVVMVMGDNCSQFLDMCFQSILDSNKIIFCWGEEDKKTLNKFSEWKKKYPDKFELISLTYDQNNLKQNGITRNFYLDYLKENYKDYWALCIDSDEVVEDFSKVKEFIQIANPGIYSPRMRHFIGDLGHEDAINQIHPVLNRLFKIDQAKMYTQVEHSVLIGANVSNQIVMDIVIWHLAYVPNMMSITKRYKNHLKKSNMHSPEYLRNWRNAHLFGTYPTNRINPNEIPDIILNKFGVDKDEFYFQNRNLEIKHFVDALDWKEFFKCKTATEFGCGKGPRVYSMNKAGIKTNGLEISKFAVENKFHPDIIQCDVTNSFSINPVDLVIAYDLLEHIPYEKLDRTIENLIKSTNRYILISVPVKGDPNLEADPTHIIKEEKDWWIRKFLDKGIVKLDTPDHFQFKDQVMIFEK